MDANLGIVNSWRVVYRLQQRLRRSRDRKKVVNRLYEHIWLSAALEIGADVEPLGNGFLEIVQGGRRTRVLNFTTPLDDPVTLNLAGDKPLTHKRLMNAHVPVPEHRAFTTRSLRVAETFLKQAAGAVIVKPAAGTAAGRGVTSGIRTIPQLRRAVAFASIGQAHLIIELVIPGDCYRFLYLDGELLDVVVRYPPTIVGDGKRTINGLIDSENERRFSGECITALGIISRDLDFRRTLSEQDLTPRSVPSNGERIVIKTVVNDGSAHDSESVKHLVGQALRTEGARAAAALDIRLAGVDIITQDLSVSLTESGGAVIEVNTTPGLHHHYLVRGVPGPPPAVPILRRLLSTERA